MKAIDVSKWQKLIDWKRVARHEVKGEKIAAVAIKVSEGEDYDDPLAERNIQGALDVGLHVAVYHYLHNSPGEAQARHFLERLSALSASHLPVILDVENKYDARPGPKALEFVQTIERELGRTPVFYTTPDYARRIETPELARCELWIADTRGRAAPEVPAPWSDWVWWQYSWRELVDGIDGYVDVNEARRLFGQSAAQVG